MSLFDRLHRWFRDMSKEGHSTSTQGAHVNGPVPQVQFRTEKCPIPIVWLDTSVLFNLAMLRLGSLKDKVQESRLTPLRQSIYNLTHRGKLICPRASQPDEMWSQRADCLDAFYQLSVGIATSPKPAIEYVQTRRLMRDYVAGTDPVAFPYVDAFPDDPLPRFAQMYTSEYVVAVDSGLVGTVEGIRSRRDTIHQDWEELRTRRVREGVTFEQQLLRERTALIDGAITKMRDDLAEVKRGGRYAEGEAGSLLESRLLLSTWDRLGGRPKGFEGLVAFFNSQYYQIAPWFDISSHLVAALMVGDRRIQHGDAMDVDHISSMLPCANLMIVDKSMRNVVRDLGLDRKYNTTVCYIGDGEELAAFFKTVEESPVSASPFPPFITDGNPRRRS